MLLSSVLITSSDNGENTALPRIIRQNIDSLKAKHPTLAHRLFGESDVVELLEAKFSREVLDAYFALRPYAYRADLARYCILYEFGGLYADLSYYFVSPVPMPGDQAVVFRGNLVSSPWDTSNGIVYAPPRHKALARAIELVCANVNRRYYGLTSLCPTGPALFGKAWATTCEAEEIVTGLAKLAPRDLMKQLQPSLIIPQGNRIHCQFLKDSLIAVKRKRLLSPGLIELGITSGNLYRELWRNRQVYV